MYVIARIGRSVGRGPTTFHNKVGIHGCRHGSFNYCNWPCRELKFLSMLFRICSIRFVAQQLLPSRHTAYSTVVVRVTFALVIDQVKS